MKALVTGASGFVGAHLVKKLLDLGHDVRILMRSGLVPKDLNGLPIEVFKGDVTDYESVINASHGCYSVFHLAGVIGYQSSMREQMQRVNVDGTAHVLSACEKVRIKKLYYMSSVVAIGAGRNKNQILNENSPFNIHDLDLGYFETKHDAENLVIEAVKHGRVNAVIGNPSTIYGAADARKGSRKTQLKVAQGKFPFYPHGGVNVVHIDDCLDGIMKIYEHGRPGERYLLTGENLTIKELFALIAEAAGVVAPFIPLPTALLRLFKSEATATATLYHWFSNEKAKKELGFNPRPAKEAIRESVNWMKENKLI